MRKKTDKKNAHLIRKKIRRQKIRRANAARIPRKRRREGRQYSTRNAPPLPSFAKTCKEGISEALKRIWRRGACKMSPHLSLSATPTNPNAPAKPPRGSLQQSRTFAGKKSTAQKRQTTRANLRAHFRFNASGALSPNPQAFEAARFFLKKFLKRPKGGILFLP